MDFDMNTEKVFQPVNTGTLLCGILKINKIIRKILSIFRIKCISERMR